MGDAEVRSIPYEKNPKVVAQYYQAADLYVHPSRIDTFPCAVLEALACGIPVVATDVGGIPEQIRGLQDLTLDPVESNHYGLNQATGVLVPTGNAEAMGENISKLLMNSALRWQMSENASTDARERFNVEFQADRYMQWYQELVGNVVPNAC
jgi:glycosyltransferase involved in cell wall biosynthesis